MTPTEMHIDAIMQKIQKLESENARLREALEMILEQFPKNYEVRITEIAREALKD